MPKITCIMPVYNTAKYLDESILSILNQSYENFEFIISDDGSNDGSKEIIDKYSKIDSRIIFLNNQKNRGIVPNLNDCINISQGEYIAIMESDDISNIDRFKIQIDEFNNDNELYLLGTKGILIDKDNAIIQYYNPNKLLNNIMDITFLTSGIMFRKNTIEKIGLFTNKYVWDLNFYYKIYYNKLKCKVIDDHLISKRIFNESTLNSNLLTIQIELLKLRFKTINEYNLEKKYYLYSVNRVFLSYSIYVTKKIGVHKFLSYYYHKYYIK